MRMFTSESRALMSGQTGSPQIWHKATAHLLLEIIRGLQASSHITSSPAFPAGPEKHDAAGIRVILRGTVAWWGKGRRSRAHERIWMSLWNLIRGRRHAVVSQHQEHWAVEKECKGVAHHEIRPSEITVINPKSLIVWYIALCSIKSINSIPV